MESQLLEGSHNSSPVRMGTRVFPRTRWVTHAKLRYPLCVELETHSVEEVVASWPEAGIAMSGDNDENAVYGLIELASDTLLAYLESEKELSARLRNHLNVLLRTLYNETDETRSDEDSEEVGSIALRGQESHDSDAFQGEGAYSILRNPASEQRVSWLHSEAVGYNVATNRGVGALSYYQSGVRAYERSVQELAHEDWWGSVFVGHGTWYPSISGAAMPHHGGLLVDDDLEVEVDVSSDHAGIILKIAGYSAQDRSVLYSTEWALTVGRARQMANSLLLRVEQLELGI